VVGPIGRYPYDVANHAQNPVKIGEPGENAGEMREIKSRIFPAVCLCPDSALVTSKRRTEKGEEGRQKTRQLRVGGFLVRLPIEAVFRKK
jgi:hypothetical protein